MLLTTWPLLLLRVLPSAPHVLLLLLACPLRCGSPVWPLLMCWTLRGSPKQSPGRTQSRPQHLQTCRAAQVMLMQMPMLWLVTNTMPHSHTAQASLLLLGARLLAATASSSTPPLLLMPQKQQQQWLWS